MPSKVMLQINVATSILPAYALQGKDTTQLVLTPKCMIQTDWRPLRTVLEIQGVQQGGP